MTRARSAIFVDTVGLVLHAIVHPADILERNGGILLISTLFGRFPFLRKMFADSGEVVGKRKQFTITIILKKDLDREVEVFGRVRLTR